MKKFLLFAIYLLFVAAVLSRIELIVPAPRALSAAELPAALKIASKVVYDGEFLELFSEQGSIGRVLASPEICAQVLQTHAISEAGLSGSQLVIAGILLLLAAVFAFRLRRASDAAERRSEDLARFSHKILKNRRAQDGAGKGGDFPAGESFSADSRAGKFSAGKFSAGKFSADAADPREPRASRRRNSSRALDFAPLGGFEPVSFDDILGASAAKAELRRICANFSAASPFRALLFAGPSGLGKTMLARALAHESQSEFTYASASSFNELYVGVGAKRIRELFAAARASAPMIIFIDEIDALGAARGNLLNKESEHTLNELLVQMDGFAASRGILLIAATNRADVLDPALLRRFSKRVQFSPPNEAERIEFARHYGLCPPLAEGFAAAITAGFAGADFAAVAQDLPANAREEAEILRAIAARRFGLAAGEAFSELQALSQAAIWTVAELCGAEVFHIAGRAIWQLAIEPSRQKALLCAQINLAADAATQAQNDDIYAFNRPLEAAAREQLREYFAPEELASALENAAEAASALLAANSELLNARAKLLLHEAQKAAQ